MPNIHIFIFPLVPRRGSSRRRGTPAQQPPVATFCIPLNTPPYSAITLDFQPNSVVRMLLLMAGVERHPGPVEVPTNADTVDWYKQTLKTGNITEDDMKTEAVKFFGDHLTKVNKRTIKTKLNIFYKKYKAMKVRAQKKAKKRYMIIK